jgi:hypothetical protein
MLIDFPKYKRAFAFGCSFTKYDYPTWADLMFDQLPNIECYNFASPGGGNQFISSRIAEANVRFKFCETDLVMVMYTTVLREDRYIDGRWQTLGNIYNQRYYDTNFVKNYVDPFGFVLRDLALIELSIRYLQSLPCDILKLRADKIENEKPLFGDKVQEAIELYKDLTDSFPPSLKETLYKNNWGKQIITRKDAAGKEFKDDHPLTIDYYNYLTYIGVNLSNKAYAEESTERIFLLKPDRSNAMSCFPVVQSRNFLSSTKMF